MFSGLMHTELSRKTTTAKFPRWLSQFLYGNNSDYKLHPTVKNGNCLFDCVCQIMKSINLHTTITHLRKVVAFPVMNVKDTLMNETLKTWCLLAKESQEPSISLELQHVQSIQDPLTPNARLQIWNNMMNPSLYWGDEHALRILEERLQCIFLIFSYNHGLHMPIDHTESSSYNPTHYTMLYLSGKNEMCKHYRPISYKGQWVFSLKDLPSRVKTGVMSKMLTPSTKL